MTNPFRNDHTDADEMNALLDAMRSGMRAPETSSEETGELSRTARQFRGLADRAARATPVPARTFDSIWEDMMSAHAMTAPTPVATGPVDRIDDTTHRVHPMREMPRPGWLQSVVSAAILVILLAGLIAAAWNLRDGNGGGTSDPGDDIRLAAPGLDTGTPETKTESDIDFFSYIDPQECAAKPLAPSDREALLNEDRNWPEGEFGPVSQPDVSNARSAALVAREFNSCLPYIVPQSLMTEQMLWLSAHSVGTPDFPEFLAQREAREREVSSYLTDIPPSDVFRFTDEVPTGGQSQNPFVFLPETAVEFPDGRIGIPATFLINQDDPTYRKEPPSALMTQLYVLENDSGAWLVDEKVNVCIGKCESYINGGEQPYFDLRVNPNLSTPIVRSAPPATPAQTPVADSQWTEWITADICKPEQSATIWAVTDTGEYTLVGPANPDDAEAAAMAARMDAACLVATNRATLDEYSDVVFDIDESFSDRATRQQAAGKAIADLYPIEEVSDYFVFTDKTPADSGNANLIFEPRHAIALEDSRIIIPGTWLIWTGDPSFIHQAPENFITQAVVMTETSDGTWAVSGNLPICLGDCDGIWPEISPFNAQYSSIRVPGGETPSPVSSPAADTDWTSWFSPQECTVEPMSDDEYAEIMRAEMSVPDRNYTVVGVPAQDDAAGAATVLREHSACANDAQTMQKRALESPYFVHVSNNGLVTDETPQERHLHDMQHGQEISAQLPNQDPNHYIVVSDEADLPSNAFVGYIYRPEDAVQLGDGRVAIPGTKLFASEPENPYLPGDMIILTDESGEWRVDEALTFCVGDCETYWSEGLDAFALPTATPAPSPETSSDEWWAWSPAGQCEPELFPDNDPTDVDLSSADHDWPEREYTPLLKPSWQDAEAVATVARQIEACSQTTGRFTPLESDRYHNSSREGVQDPDRLGDQTRASREISAAYPITDPTAFIQVTTEEPVRATPNAMERSSGVMSAQRRSGLSTLPVDAQYSTNVYIPDMAVQLADGRIAIPGASLLAQGTPEAEAKLAQLDHGAYLTTMLVFSKQDDHWLLDETLALCIGECDLYWENSEQMATRAANAQNTRVASPAATPETSIDWTAWITAEECTLEPMDAYDVAAIKADTDGYPVPTYNATTEPTTTDAQHAAAGVRRLAACVSPQTAGSYGTDAYIWRYQSPNSPLSENDAHVAFAESNGREVSRDLADAEPADFYLPSDPPAADTQGLPQVYLPDNAIGFPDGRIGIPPTYLYPADDEASLVIPDTLYSIMPVMSESDGEWLQDDFLLICIGECDDYINGGPWWPELTSTPEALPATAPVSSPDAETNWTAWISPQECTVEPMSDDEYAEIMRAEMSVPKREYTVIGTPDQSDAVAAATVLRQHEACANDRQTMQKRALESPYYVHVTNGGTVIDQTPQERRMHQVQHGQELSSQIPNQNPMHYVERMDGKDIPAGFAGFVYRPDDAVRLSDGRIAIPATKLFGTLREDPDLTTFVMILTNESGEWRVDESLSLCVGDCDAYWSDVREYQGIPSSPISSPIATPGR